jgi:hypothetical protein
MSSADRVTNSPDPSVERLEPAASAPDLQGHSPPGEARKARRRARSEGEPEDEEQAEELDLGDRAGEPPHQIDSLA